jgi:Tfp pilus assembly protein PilN
VITKLNLASKPFRNRTTPYVLSLLMLAIAVAATLLMFAKLNDNQRLNEIAENDIAEFQEQIDALNAKVEMVQRQLTPEQRDLLVASHKLVASKSFGWSRLFYDLESVMPGSVSASRISVENVFQEGDRVRAELDFAVLSRDYQGVMAMIGAMNNSGVFNAELRSQNLQSNQRMTYSEYTLRLIYTPPFGVNPDAGEVAQTSQGGGE